uniref:Uncharacterized protein n=1 Tax=Anguilla anguilla TaxID=7936 RepID=A0A0E9UJR1_ANGAN
MCRRTGSGLRQIVFYLCIPLSALVSPLEPKN